MFDTRAVISTTNKSDEIKCDLCGKKMIFKNLYRHYNVVHNQTYRKQEKQKTGPKKKKNNEKDNDKKKGVELVRKKKVLYHFCQRLQRPP
jgi:DNA-directed RNA polymerase subunit RPC12/RpoP